MGGLCGRGEVGSANNTDNDATKGSGNSLKETLANIFTPNDNMKYQDGVLVDTTKPTVDGQYTPLPYKAGAFYDIPEKSNNINVTNTNRSNRIFTPDEQANFTQKNSAREDLANILKPFDGARYVGGNLLNEETGQSLTGGGYATNKAGFKNYIYGVSDDFTNNAPLKQGNMSNKDYTLALAKQSQLQNIPPSNAEYFSSFLPSLVAPGLGGILSGKILEGGINKRRAMMDQHQAALDGGAKAIMSTDNKVYLGYETGDGVVKYEENPPTDPMTDSSIGALNMGNDGNDGNQQPTAGWPPETGMGGGTTVPISDLNQPERMTSYDPIPAGIYAGPMWEEFLRDVLPSMQKQMQASNIMPNMTQNQIDEAFLIWRNTQQNSVVAN